MQTLFVLSHRLLCQKMPWNTFPNAPDRIRLAEEKLVANLISSAEYIIRPEYIDMQY